MDVSNTETVLLPKFVTYVFYPSGIIATPKESLPAGTVAITKFVDVSTTETLPSSFPGLLHIPFSH
jgi:hypothetical protein